MDRPRRLDWEPLLNARDIGGYPAAGGGATRWGALVRADSLSSLTPAGRAAVIAYGVRTVVDLRMPDEVAHEPNPFAVGSHHGVAYRNLSFIDPAGEIPDAAATLAEDYAGMLRRFGPRVASVITAIAEADDGAVVVHCAAGKDRTGLVVAMLLSSLGVPPDVVAADYALSAEHLRPRDDAYLADGPGRRTEREAALSRWRASPEVMLAVLAGVDTAYGGAAGYLAWAGVPHGDLARLRARLLEPG